MTAHQPTLVIFCKRPTLTQGKRRLALDVGLENALQLAHGMLACALEDAALWPGPVVLAISATADVRWAHGLMARPYTVVAQGSGGLGERLNRVDRLLRAQRQRRLIFTGTDAPALTEPHYHAVTDALNDAQVALCPARDGGVTIMANAEPWPHLQPLPWSTADLGAALRGACTEAGYRVRTTLESYDIDVSADLHPLAHDLRADHRAARRRLLRTVEEILTGVPPATAHAGLCATDPAEP